MGRPGCRMSSADGTARTEAMRQEKKVRKSQSTLRGGERVHS